MCDYCHPWKRDEVRLVIKVSAWPVAHSWWPWLPVYLLTGRYTYNTQKWLANIHFQSSSPLFALLWITCTIQRSLGRIKTYHFVLDVQRAVLGRACYIRESACVQRKRGSGWKSFKLCNYSHPTQAAFVSHQPLTNRLIRGKIVAGIKLTAIQELWGGTGTFMSGAVFWGTASTFPPHRIRRTMELCLYVKMALSLNLPRCSAVSYSFHTLHWPALPYSWVVFSKHPELYSHQPWL